MIRLLADEDFDHRAFRGVISRLPLLDIVRVQDVGLRSARDPIILNFAAAESRIVLSHDEHTMGVAAAHRLIAGLPMCGLFLIPQQTAIRIMIDSIVFVAECSRDDEWNGLIQYLPL